MIHEHASPAAVAGNGPVTRPSAELLSVAPRYRHILVPTFLDPADRPALLQATELASFHGATLAVLYVRPDEEPANSINWLDAIDRLHRGLNGGSDLSAGDGPTDSDLVSRRIKQFLERELPASLVDEVEIHIDWRSGDPGDVIVKFADAAAADLIVLSSGPSRWWLPSLPGSVRRVLQQSNREVLIVRPDARPKPAEGAV